MMTTSCNQQKQEQQNMDKENNELTAFDMQLEVSTLHHHAVRRPESVAIYGQQQRSWQWQSCRPQPPCSLYRAWHAVLRGGQLDHRMRNHVGLAPNGTGLPQRHTQEMVRKLWCWHPHRISRRGHRGLEKNKFHVVETQIENWFHRNQRFNDTKWVNAEHLVFNVFKDVDRNIYQRPL